MRIVSGRFRSRALQAPRGLGTRPTTDRVKEAMFSMLASQLDLAGASVLDLYAGTGALGLEALSRGAAHVTFVERDRSALRSLQDNVRTLGVESCVTILPTAVERTRLGGAFDLALADPPYELVTDGSFRRTWQKLDLDVVPLVLEHSSRDASPQLGRPIWSAKIYGDSAVTFYAPLAEQPG